MITEINDLKTAAPAVFRTKEEGAAPGASKHYKFITTLDIINDMSKLGWEVFTASQRNSKKAPDTTKHMVVFRSKQYGQVGNHIPEILLINSHNRTSSFTFHVGLFRSISNTRLIINNETFANLNLRHMGYSFESIQNTINHITDSMPIIFNTINQFMGVNLSDEQQTKFALLSFSIRYPEYVDEKTNEVNMTKIIEHLNPAELLLANRDADKNNDLWHVFNRIQENLIGGNFGKTSAETKTRQPRAIVELGSNIKINKGLWSLAETFAK